MRHPTRKQTEISGMFHSDVMPQTFSNETESASGQLKAGDNMQTLKIHLGPFQDVCHCPPGALSDAI